MMYLRSLFIFFTVFGFLVCPVPLALAADNADDNKAGATKEASDKPPVDPVFKEKSGKLNTEIMELVKGLDQSQAQHFMVMYTNYTMISMVKAVEKDVKNAVEACRDNNSSMEDELNARFSKWQKAISQPMSDAMANINNMIVAQQYTSRSKIEGIFEQVEDVRGYNSSRFEKVPVSTREACEFMLDKMDETQQSMVGLLKTTLYSYPGALQRTQK